MIKTLVAVPGVNTYNINNLKAGLYFIQIPAKNVYLARKFIKKCK